MRPDQLDLLVTVSAPAIVPGTSTAIVSAVRPDSNDDRYRGQLFRLDLSGSKSPVKLTRGYRDTDPVVSGDGRYIVFQRAGKDGPPQLFLLGVEGGEPVQLTDEPLGAGEPVFSPDTRQVAYTARVAEHGRYGTDESVPPASEPPRLIDAVKYQANGVGYVDDQPRHVFVIDLPDTATEPGVDDPMPDAVRVTNGIVDHSAPIFEPDGRRIAFIAARHPGRDRDLYTDVYVADVPEKAEPIEEGDPDDRGRAERPTEPQKLTETDLSIGSVRFDRGDLLLLAGELGASGTDFVAATTGLYRKKPGERARRITDSEQVELDEGLGLKGLDDGAVLAGRRERGAVRLVRIEPDGGVEPRTPSDRVVTGFDAVDGAIIVSYSDASTAGDVAVVEGDGPTPVTDFSFRLRAETRLARFDDVTVTAPDGHPVHGWVVVPDGDGPHPVLLNIHGGPFAGYQCSFFDEAQVYAAAGYAVVMCNPRGSAGYGRAHGRAVKGDLAAPACTDVLTFLDQALDRGDLDSGRLGVMGGSYGGYLTAWIIAHDDRFQAAIVERGMLEPESFAGTSDIGSYFGFEYVGSDPERIAAQSPYAAISGVDTPVLVVHSENDLRCPLEQGQRYFQALKRRGVDAELLVFPGENHELSRSGTPKHRVARFEHILRWWSMQLPA